MPFYKDAGLYVAMLAMLGFVSQLVMFRDSGTSQSRRVDENNNHQLFELEEVLPLSRFLSSDATSMTENCVALKVDLETETTEQDDNTCFCELRGADVGDFGFQIVEMKDVPEHYCDAHIKPGQTEIKPGDNLLIEDGVLKCISHDDPHDCWKALAANDQFQYNDHIQGSLHDLVSYNELDSDRRLTRRRLVTGERTVLILRGISTDTATPSSAELSDAILGTHGDPFNMATQYAACSYGQLRFVAGQFGTDGVMDINTGMPAKNQDHMPIRNALYVGAYRKLGMFFNRVDHTMMCIPAETKDDWVAYAIVDHWLSWFNAEWCTYASVQLHEMGHNLGLSHAGQGDKEYADKSGMMGYSYAEDDTPVMCFNAQKTYDLNWFPQYTLVFDSRTFDSWEGNLVGFVDKANAGGSKMIIRMKDRSNGMSYYIHFNRAADFNRGTLQGADRVLISTKGDSYEPSWRQAVLGGGEEFSIDDFGGQPIKVKTHSIADNGDGVVRAHVSIVNPNKVVPETASPTKAPTISTPSPTVSTPSPTVSTPSPTVSTPSPTVSTPSPTVSTPSPTVSTPSPTVSTPSPTVSTPSPTVSTPSPTVSTPSPTVSTPSPTVSTPSPTISTPAPFPYSAVARNSPGTQSLIKDLEREQEDLALFKPAKQSLTEPAFNDWWGAGSSVDGDIHHVSNTGPRRAQRDNWWQVDLAGIAKIEYIRIKNRVDCENCWKEMAGGRIEILNYKREPVYSVTIQDSDAPDVVYNVGGVEGSYVSVSHYESVVMSEAMVYGTMLYDNLALEKPTMASSEMGAHVPAYWGSQRPVESNHLGLYSYVTNVKEASWRVDLQGVATIDKIVLWNRFDCFCNRLKGAKVNVLDQNYGLVTVVELTEEEPDVLEVVFDPPVEGSYVQINKNDDEHLALGEVQVFGHVIGQQS